MTTLPAKYTRTPLRLTGFTLIELLVVVAIILIVVPVLYISFSNYRANRALEISAEAIADNLRMVHIYAREANDEKAWGVRSVSDNSYDIVSGNSTTWTSERHVELLSPITFDANFVLWFVIGIGEKDILNSDPPHEPVRLTSPTGRSIRVNVLDTGVVEVSND